MKTDKKQIDASKIPLDSSLGLLAYGDAAFKAWRELKKEHNKKEHEKK